MLYFTILSLKHPKLAKTIKSQLFKSSNIYVLYGHNILMLACETKYFYKALALSTFRN